jgi:PAS domain S-box-containing protein
MHVPTVLMLESDSAIAEELGRRLFKLGYPLLHIVSSEAEAESLISTGHPELILLDIHFGGPRVGLNLAMRIRMIQDLPVIFIIPERSSEIIKDDELNEAYGFITTPFDNTTIHAVLGMARNQYRKHEAARENEIELKSILKNTNDGIITVDAQGRILSINQVAANLTGFLEANALGSRLDTVMTIIEKTSQKQIEVSELILRRRHTGPLSGLDVVLIGSNGNHIPVDGNVAPLRDYLGRPSGALIAFRSLSEIQRSLLQSKTQAAHSEALLRVLEQINSHFNIEDILVSLLKESTLILDADAAAVLLMDDDENYYKIVSTYANNERLSSYPYNDIKVKSETIGGLISQEQSVVCIPNIQKLAGSGHQ